MARNGRVNEPSMTRPTRHTKMPRLSHLCMRAYCFVVPSGRSSLRESPSADASALEVGLVTGFSLFREDFAVDGVQIGDSQERCDVHDVVDPPSDDWED